MFRVPPHMIGDLEQATFSNIEEQSLEFVVYSLMPWIKRWEGIVNKRLLGDKDRQAGYFAKFDVDALLRGDFETRMRGYQAQFSMGAISPNEIRDKEGMNPRPDGGGDEYFTPVNMTTHPDGSVTTTQDPKKNPSKPAPGQEPQPQKEAA